MRILIIGGSGFVSGTLARAAVAAGHDTWIVSRGQRPLPDGAHSLVADRGVDADLSAAIAGAGTSWDLAVDCIGYETAHMAQDLRVLPAVCDWFVFVSTDFVFDPEQRIFPQTVEARSYQRDGYGGKKRLCEELLANQAPADWHWTVMRPCHIYGPGSLLGCLPLHCRDAQLITRLRKAETLQLIGGGHFLQQPVFAQDLAATILSAPAASGADRHIFCTAGPDIIESVRYYELVADAVGCGLQVEEVAVQRYRREHPERSSFLCHRIYDLAPLHAAGLAVPATGIEEGLQRHVQWALRQEEQPTQPPSG